MRRTAPHRTDNAPELQRTLYSYVHSGIPTFYNDQWKWLLILPSNHHH